MKAKAAAKLAASKAEELPTKPTPAYAIIKKTPPPVKEFEENVSAAVATLPKGSITFPLNNVV
jgi:hypothetical protein